jgi:MFS family permease
MSVSEYVEDMLREAREELVRADGKAALILAASGVAVGALLGGFLAGSWQPFDLSNSIEWLWWVGVVLAAIGLYRLACSVYPQTRRKGPEPEVLAYYVDVNRFKGDLAALKEKLAESAARAEDRQVDQLRQVCGIAGDKYAGIKAGLFLLGAAAVLCTVAALLGS